MKAIYRRGGETRRLSFDSVQLVDEEEEFVGVISVGFCFPCEAGRPLLSGRGEGLDRGLKLWKGEREETKDTQRRP